VRTLLPSAALAFVIAVLLSSPAGLAQGTAGTATPSGDAARSSPDAALIKTYCTGCHNDRTKSGELSLEHADLANISLHADLWEKVIRKVRAGMMPPAGMPRPDAATLDAFVGHLETTIDRAAAANPGSSARDRSRG
jgi:cytochrome c553